MSLTPQALFRIQAGAWAALLILSMAVLYHAIRIDDEVPFLLQGDGPAWIMAPLPRTADLIVVDPENPPKRVFSKRFNAEGGSAPALLRGRALRGATARLNDEPLVLRSLGSGWKEGFDADLTGRLLPGRNQLEVTVVNPAGPALLQLEIDQPGEPVVSDASWEVSDALPGRVHAQRATDLALHPEARNFPSALQVRPGALAWVLGAFAIGATLAWRRPHWLTRIPENRWPLWTLGAVVLFWVLVFAFKFAQMPALLGFDAPGHLAYIDYLLEHRALPTAAYGFSTYHPPLFYGLTSGLALLFGSDPSSFGGAIVYRLIPFASGLANVLLVAFAARRIWPGEGLRPSLAIAAAGLLPMNLYMSAYVSNEPLLAAWVSGALALGIGILLAERLRPLALAALTLILGAALLTKFTALALAPVIAFFVVLRAWLLDGHGPARSLAFFGAMGAGALALSGWFYLRNWLLFGDPLVWNLDVPGAASWWMRPGFHTAGWYARFGEALSYPFFAGYASFWDGLYSTFWGDGLVGGMARASTRHAFWNDEFQRLVYPLALPATLAIVAGAGKLWLDSFREKSVALRLVFSMLVTVLFLLAFSLGLISLRLAFYAQAKAFYLLCAVLPLAIAAAEGLAAPARWASQGESFPRRALLCAWAGWGASLAACIGLAYLG